jgi:hypothetical protein
MERSSDSPAGLPHMGQERRKALGNPYFDFVAVVDQLVSYPRAEKSTIPAKMTSELLADRSRRAGYFSKRSSNPRVSHQLPKVSDSIIDPRASEVEI